MITYIYTKGETKKLILLGYKAVVYARDSNQYFKQGEIVSPQTTEEKANKICRLLNQSIGRGNLDVMPLVDIGRGFLR